MTEALQVATKHNLCTFYLLPLTGLNKRSFGTEENFRDCYVNPEGTELYVAVYYLTTTLQHHPRMIRTEGRPGAPVYVFELQQEWQDHFQLFKQGKYSQFSKRAYDLIIENSGLRFKAVNPNGLPTTDLRLLAIDPDASRRDILRKKLSEHFGVEIERNAELLSPPPEKSFATFNESLMAKL